MGIKNLFDGKTNEILTSTSLEEEVVKNVSELESADNVREQIEKINRFIPRVDFDDPHNFAFYGSAESYYKDAITRIYSQYPYDGSEEEITEFLNQSNYLDLHILNNKYPRTTGYAILSADGWGTISSPAGQLTGGYGLSSEPEYIKIVGGPHTASGGIPTGSMHVKFTGSNYYDTDIYTTDGTLALGRTGGRESNLKFNLSDGVTTEFWFNKGVHGDTAATATITFSDTDGGSIDYNQDITIISTDGTSKTYTTKAANDYANNEFDADGGFDDKANALKGAIEHASGHAGKITVTRADNVLTLTQAATGRGGNTLITEDITDCTAVSFTGGLGGGGAKEVLFDLWNGRDSGSADHGRLLIYYEEAATNPIGVHLASGSNVWDCSFGQQTTGNGTLTTVTTESLEDTWNHMAFVFSTSSVRKDLQIQWYYNGVLNYTTSSAHAATFNEVTGSLIGFIGALQAAPHGTTATAPIGATWSKTSMEGYGKLSGSIDEFRYWKTARTGKDIAHNWWTQVRGGTNQEVANAELGVYYKFNEGITARNSIDSTVLDYSGRVSNGQWVGYPGKNARNIGSAINSSTNVVTGTVEFKDPIIYSEHSDVVSLHNTLTATGSFYDFENQASIKDSIPSWIVEEDHKEGAGDLDKISQIVGSYFDTLHLQVQSLPQLKENTYLSASHKPAPFTNRAISSAGLVTPEVFIDATLLELFANRREDREYSIDINEAKNLIYQNIYNNLIYIYKSKGTEKAFRNLIRCYGIGDEIVKFNAYGNNTTFKFSDTHYETIARKNYIDFNHPDRFEGTVFQSGSKYNPEATTAGQITSYVSGTNQNFANTAECEVLFPKKLEFKNPEYFNTPFLSASIFGHHTASVKPDRFEWPPPGNDANFQLYAVRTEENARDVYFQLKSRDNTFSLTSSVYSNVYDNQKWNFAVRVKDKFHPYANGITGSSTNDQILEFYGVNTELGIVRNEFMLTASGLNAAFITKPRRYYAGADRRDFTGSVHARSDAKVSSVRHWASYLDNETIKAHAMDPENVGTLHPARNIFFGANGSPSPVDNQDIPTAVSLAMHWDFSQITGSDASGEFVVDDASSGSLLFKDRYVGAGSSIPRILNSQHTARGYFPSSLSTAKMVDKVYMPSAKQRLPEVVNSSDAVNVLKQDDDLYPRDAAVSQTFFAFEKSMYGIVSQEMVNLFATIVEFNNLIGEVTSKYRGEYKDLRLLRHYFFEKIQNSPDLDKFIDYYKWIDSSLSVFLQQLSPASANISDEIRVVVEDHILGRSKYRHQYPMLDYKGNERWGAGDDAMLEARVRGINELTYNWQYGHAPLPTAGSAIATITFSDSDTGGSIDYNQDITIISTDGTSKTYTTKAANDYTNNEFDADGGFDDKANALKGAIEHAAGHAGKITVSRADNVLTLTQATPGAAGNTTITEDVTDCTKTDFTGGGETPLQVKNALWWKERAERTNVNFDVSTSVSTARQTINDILLSFQSASMLTKFNTGPNDSGQKYDGSTYALRRFTPTLKMKAEISSLVRSGYNYPRNQKPDFYFGQIKHGDTTAGQDISKGSFKDITLAESGPPILQTKRKFKETAATHNNAGNEYTSAKAELVGPFVIFSSSAPTMPGYRATLSDDSIEYNGIHFDTYGDDHEIPMQGPFTQEHVGGNRHRHVSLNTGSATNHDQFLRQEAYALQPDSKLRAYDATNAHLPSSHPQYRRDGIAKRPVNIRNIQHTTASVKLGNFNKRYEIVQTSDRMVNNSEFVKNEGFSTASITPSTHATIEGLTDYSKPTRNRREHVFVEKFSSPGGPETAGDHQGGPGLDVESGQYSPYNNLNYRNLSIRRPLQTLLTERSEVGGLRSGTGPTPLSMPQSANPTASFHKINRNTLRRPAFSNEYGSVQHESGAVGTSSAHDNFYVQHMIPQTDYQYAWITGSIVTNDKVLFGGYFPYDGLVQKSAHATAIIEVADGDANTGFAELEHVLITSTDGTTKRYVIIDDNASAVTLGTILEEGSDYGSDTLDADDDAIGGIAVPVHLGGTHTSQQGFLNLIKQAIEHANGHDGKILVSAVPPEDNGPQSITLTQASEGFNGNKPISSDISQINCGQPGGFHGGRDKHEDAAINFTSASEIGTGIDTTRQPRILGGNYAPGTFVPTDFAGLNTTIVEPISGSAFTLGYPHTARMFRYYNFSNFRTVTFTARDESFVQKLVNNQIQQVGSLNNIINHRNGPYGYPTWKQVRVGQGALGRHYRKNNIYTHTPDASETNIIFNVHGGTTPIQPRYEATMRVTQSVVTSKYRPIVHELLMKTGKTTGRGNQKTEITKPLIIQSSYANGFSSFTNTEFANKIELPLKTKDTPYNQIKAMYMGGALDDPASPVAGVNRIIYSEIVYPSEANMHQKKVRGRTGYQNNFWRDSRTDRTALASNAKPSNSAGTILEQSAWSLDADENFITDDYLRIGFNDATALSPGGGLAMTGGISANNAAGAKPGELQNKYVHYICRSSGEENALIDQSLRRPGVLYSRKHIMPFTASVATAWGMRNKGGLIPRAKTGGSDRTPTASIGSGEAFWDAPKLAGSYQGTSSAFVSRSVNPFYDKYEDYFFELKARGQGYSIIPEFRMEDHLNYYKDNHAEDYLADNLEFLQIVGVPSASKPPQNSSEDNFYQVFTNSDFMKYFEIVKEDHKGLVRAHTLKMKCRALKKFIPYDGFYPAERTLQMATQFSKSIGPNVEYTGAESANKAAYNVFLKPFMAPGILYNTIKAGLAVDYPVLTGSYHRVQLNGYDNNVANRTLMSSSWAIASNSRSGSVSTVSTTLAVADVLDSTTVANTSEDLQFKQGARCHNDGWDYRVPFEAILDPGKYINNKTIVCDEPSPFAHIPATASWNGTYVDRKYNYMMHNFLAETVNFFLRDGQVTSITSKPNIEWKSMEPGQPYGMRIKLYRSMDTPIPSTGDWGDFPLPQSLSGSGQETFTMYSRPSAFGPPVASAEGADAALQAHRVTGYSEFTPAQGVYGSHTPPYYDGEAWIDVIYYPFVASSSVDPPTSHIGDPERPSVEAITTLSPILPAGTDGFLGLDDKSARFGIGGTYIRTWRYDQEVQYRVPNSTYNASGSNIGPMGGAWVNQWAMQGDSSLNIFERVIAPSPDNMSSTTALDRWKISTKFETPMLNFNHVNSSDLTLVASTRADSHTTGEALYNDSVNQTIPRGMWHQFGRLPRTDEGVFLQITDIPENWLENHPSSSVIPDPFGFFARANRFSKNIENIDDAETAKTNFDGFTGYRFTDGLHSKVTGVGGQTPESSLTATPKSLIDICGFTTDPKRIGEVRSIKEIKEAIVAVPFREINGERKFFGLPDGGSAIVPSYYSSYSAESVRRQVRLMQDYIFPPQFDFVNNNDASACAMYIFEFKHKLNKDDLAHIWQNLPPRIATRSNISTATITHELLVNELLADPADALSNMLEGTQPHHIPMPKNIQWMVFKVKQRGKNNYFESLGRGNNEEVPFYSYNWPYDYFSLVELAQIETEVEFANTAKKRLRSGARELRSTEGGYSVTTDQRQPPRGPGSRTPGSAGDGSGYAGDPLERPGDEDGVDTRPNEGYTSPALETDFRDDLTEGEKTAGESGTAAAGALGESTSTIKTAAEGGQGALGGASNLGGPKIII